MFGSLREWNSRTQERLPAFRALRGVGLGALDARSFHRDKAWLSGRFIAVTGGGRSHPAAPESRREWRRKSRSSRAHVACFGFQVGVRREAVHS
jgi:hypothetical protein